MSYTQTWLEDTTRARGLLVVATVFNKTVTAEQTLCFSTMPFITGDGIAFTPLVVGDVEITETLSISGGGANITFGTVNIANPNGEYDDWIDPSKYVWSNRSIKIYFGDPTWSASSIANLEDIFYKVYDGVIDECKSPDRGSLSWILRDKLERLNVALTENTIDTDGVWYPSQNNQDAIRPVVFGEVHNMTPILIDPSTLKYRFNDGGCEDLIEVRDNGYPIYRYNGDVSGLSAVSVLSGTFNLARPPAGIITCSVQGVKTTYNVTTATSISATYRNTVIDMIYLLATTYGSTNMGKLSQADIDTVNFQYMAGTISGTAACSYLVTDRVNLLQVIQELAASIGGSVYCNRSGKLQILRIGVPTQDAAISITDSDILLHTLTLQEKVPVVGSIKLGYAKNWTVQQNLATYIDEQTKNDFSEEWFVETVVDSATVVDYKLATDPPQRNTYLVNSAQTVAEATRLVNYYKTPRSIFSFVGTSKLMGVKLGQQVTLTHNRFGLQSGKTGQVIKCTPRWCKGLIDLEVIV